jgi:hypothetical protein
MSAKVIDQHASPAQGATLPSWTRMVVPRACPLCEQGDVVIERDRAPAAVCSRCGYATDVDTMRKRITLRALEATRQRERALQR